MGTNVTSSATESTCNTYCRIIYLPKSYTELQQFTRLTSSVCIILGSKISSVCVRSMYSSSFGFYNGGIHRNCGARAKGLLMALLNYRVTSNLATYQNCN